MDHLKQWASDHESSAQFHGRIDILPTGSEGETFQLGKSVKCALTHADSQKTRKQIIIRLFPPRTQDARYAMVIRCGSGWMSARDFFNKEHLLLLQAERKTRELKEAWGKGKRAQASHPRIPAFRDVINKARKADPTTKSTPQPEEDPNTSIRIGPIFHHFLRLPQEIQDMIWVTAAGLTGMYRPCRHRTSDFPVPHISENFYPRPKSPITLSVMLRVCKSLNAHMAPWIYRTTKFQFELTGFTNFLWVSGPENRKNLRRVTFKFSSLAPLHCLRWLSPDPVFALFDPPAYTSPHGLQYFWRCQIQDLARELHLQTLTLDLQGVQPEHVQMVVRILRQAFGSVQHVRLQENGVDLQEGHWRLAGLREGRSWRDMCRAWYKAYSSNQGYMSDERRGKSPGELEKDMDEQKEFFDSVEGMSVRMP